MGTRNYLTNEVADSNSWPERAGESSEADSTSCPEKLSERTFAPHSTQQDKPHENFSPRMNSDTFMPSCNTSSVVPPTGTHLTSNVFLRCPLFPNYAAKDRYFLPNQQGYLSKLAQPKGIEVCLENEQIWREFGKYGTEMVVTKCGRRMFPIVKICISNLDPEVFYFVMLDIIPVDDNRYKFVGNQWIHNGLANSTPPPRLYLHPDSPAPGTKWTQQPVSFYKVKLTNNTQDRDGNIVLSSMRKYVVRVHVVQGSDVTLLPWSKHMTFPLPETTFIAVTAYQNQKVTNLKVENNPFARGFKSMHRAKRRTVYDEDSDSDDSFQVTGSFQKGNGKVNRTAGPTEDLLSKTASRQRRNLYDGETSEKATTSVDTDSNQKLPLPLDVPLTVDTGCSSHSRQFHLPRFSCFDRDFAPRLNYPPVFPRTQTANAALGSAIIPSCGLLPPPPPPLSVPLLYHTHLANQDVYSEWPSYIHNTGFHRHFMPYFPDRSVSAYSYRAGNSLEETFS